MPDPDDALHALREALRVSPDNGPLRKHYADTLLKHGRHAEAETVYREALAGAAYDLGLQIGLAEAFLAQAKYDEALVVLESIVDEAGCPPRARVVYARALLRTDDRAEAARQYLEALDRNPDLADRDLAALLRDDLPGEAKPRRPSFRSPLDDLPLLGDDFDAEFEAEFEDEDDDFDPEVDRYDLLFGGRVPVQADPESDPGWLDPERPKITFDDVGGMEALKEEIRLKIIYPLQHVDLYKAYGKAMGGGILMYGPPGCGKTHLARATAGEVDAAFIAVGLHDVLDMWLGQSEQNLHGFFEQARSLAPCVLFFDEVDALGASRVDMRRSGARQLINQFLAELDGLEANNDGLLVLAATNAPWHLDGALRRPGRFDRILFVPPPDREARTEILQLLLDGKPLGKLDVKQVARKTEAFSGADLKALVDVTVEGKLQAAMKTGIPKPIETRDLLQAAKALRPTTKEWFATARNHALYANEGGLYDDVLDYLNIKRR